MSVPSQLPNYLRMYRKRAGLSQADVAQLLGCRSGAKVSRYERFGRSPNLETLLAYEVIFGTSIRELFGGTARKMETLVTERARALSQRLQEHGTRLPGSRKLSHLSDLAPFKSANPDAS